MRWRLITVVVLVVGVAAGAASASWFWMRQLQRAEVISVTNALRAHIAIQRQLEAGDVKGALGSERGLIEVESAALDVLAPPGSAWGEADEVRKARELLNSGSVTPSRDESKF